jgi:hypothetical protein
MIRAGMIVTALTAAALLGSTALQAQGMKKGNGVSTSGTRSRGAAGADANIRRDDTPNALNKPATAEPAGKSTRGASAVEPGQICVDSRVDLYVKIYVDGTFVGTVSPWGDSCGYYGDGEHRIYARAVFTDGSSTTWGPVTGDSSSGFKWTIRN